MEADAKLQSTNVRMGAPTDTARMASVSVLKAGLATRATFTSHPKSHSVRNSTFAVALGCAIANQVHLRARVMSICAPASRDLLGETARKWTETSRCVPTSAMAMDGVCCLNNHIANAKRDGKAQAVMCPRAWWMQATRCAQAMVCAKPSGGFLNAHATKGGEAQCAAHPSVPIRAVVMGIVWATEPVCVSHNTREWTARCCVPLCPKWSWSIQLLPRRAPWKQRKLQRKAGWKNSTANKNVMEGVAVTANVPMARANATSSTKAHTANSLFRQQTTTILIQ